jgi:hypothetical protein
MDKKIKFTKSFYDPDFGNVWINRIVTVPGQQAQRFLVAKLAVEIQEQKEASSGKRGRPRRNKAAS